MDGIGKQALREPKLRQECMFLICAQFWIFRFYLFNLECLWSPWNYGGGAEKRRGSRIQGIGHILTGKLVRNTRAFYGLSRNGEKKMGQERGRVNGVNQPKLRINENTFENHYSDQYPAWMVNVFPRIYWLINEISMPKLLGREVLQFTKRTKVKAIAIAPGCPTELNGTILLLKIPHFGFMSWSENFLFAG